MLNILDQIETEAREQGRTEGMTEGINRGRTEGMAEGISRGRTIGLINGAIDAFREVGMPEDKILVRITQKFNLTKEKALEYMKQNA